MKQFIFYILTSFLASNLYAMPKPSVSANGTTKEKTITDSEAFSIKISLDATQASQKVVDWWVSASTPFGEFSYTTTGWVVGKGSSFAAPAVTFRDFELLNSTGLPEGQYKVDFSLDHNNDGIQDDTFQDSLLLNIGKDIDLRCKIPNPRRVQISNQYDYFNILVDGGFETSDEDVLLEQHEIASLKLFQGTLRTEAAYSGSKGYKIQSDKGHAGYFWFNGKVDKGHTNQYGFWIRSAKGPVTINPEIRFTNSRGRIEGQPIKQEPVEINDQWQQLSYRYSSNNGVHKAQIGFEVKPNQTFYIDDGEISIPRWTQPVYEVGQGKKVGVIDVPVSKTPTYFSIVIHIEDPGNLQTSPAYFFQQSAVFQALSKIFHQHGGFLTIQPEEDWVMGAVDKKFAPTLLEDLVNNYNTHFSTHTHGPNCIDPSGRPRSSSDCLLHKDWDSNVSDDDVITYVRNLKALIERAAKTEVNDHNGNFDFTTPSRYSEVPMTTLSAFKNKLTQSTYDYLINNPWRPTEGDALRKTDQFLTHDEETKIIYVPGVGQATSTHHERVLGGLKPIVGQFMKYADPNRVNTLYLVMHVGKFFSLSGERDYIRVNEQTKEIIYSDEFKTHLNYWDEMLTKLIDPLVKEGYLEWVALDGMGEKFKQWEAKNCP